MTSPCCSSLTNTLASGSNGRQLLAKLLHQLWRSLDGARVDQNLREIGCRWHRVDVVIEARKAGAQEARVATNFAFFC